MKHTITLNADDEAKLLEYGKKCHLSDYSQILGHIINGVTHGHLRHVGTGRIRVKPVHKWRGTLPSKCYEPGTMPDRGYWSKPLARKAHLLCITSHFPGSVVRKKIRKSEEVQADGYKNSGWKLERELNLVVWGIATPQELEWMHRGFNGKNATVGDLITTLELIYKAKGLDVPSKFA